MSDFFDIPTVMIKSGDSYAIINESDFDPEKHEKYEAPPVAPPAPPPPPPGSPPDAIDSLKDDWKSSDADELKKLAASVSGRTVENKQQAIQVIAAEIKRRAAQ